MAVLSVFTGRHSSPVVEAIFRLHFPDVNKVIDMTWGKGNFWKWDYQFELTGVDISKDADVTADARKLDYPDGCFDVGVIDPPFMGGATVGGYSSTVGLDDAFSRLRNQRDVFALYTDLMTEGTRLTGGNLIVKCKDIIESGRYWPTESSLVAFSKRVDLNLEDKVVFIPDITLVQDPKWQQQHFRRQESYFLIFKNRQK